MNPLVYVVILNWNGWRDTVACVRSLESLTYDNYRILIVDNGSHDDSLPQLKSACPSAELLETGENLGFAGGNNVGIRHAINSGAEYVWILNNDTSATPASLSAMVELAQRDTGLAMVGSVLYYMNNPERIQAWGGGKVNLWFGIARHHYAPVPVSDLHYLTGASILLAARALPEIGLFDDGFFMYWEDTDFGLRARKAGWRLAVSPEARILHKEGGSIGKGSATADSYFNASFVRFCRRHAPVPFIPICICVTARLLKRALAGDWVRVRAVWRATFSALTKA